MVPRVPVVGCWGAMVAPHSKPTNCWPGALYSATTPGVPCMKASLPFWNRSRALARRLSVVWQPVAGVRHPLQPGLRLRRVDRHAPAVRAKEVAPEGTQPVQPALLDGDVGHPPPHLVFGPRELLRPGGELVGRPVGVGQGHLDPGPPGQGLVDEDGVAAEVAGAGDAVLLALVGEHLQGLLPIHRGVEAVGLDDRVEGAQDALGDAPPPAVRDDPQPHHVRHRVARREDQQLLGDGAPADLLELHLDRGVLRLEDLGRLLLEPLHVPVCAGPHQGPHRHGRPGERQRSAPLPAPRRRRPARSRPGRRGRPRRPPPPPATPTRGGRAAPPRAPPPSPALRRTPLRGPHQPSPRRSAHARPLLVPWLSWLAWRERLRLASAIVSRGDPGVERLSAGRGCRSLELSAGRGRLWRPASTPSASAR